MRWLLVGSVGVALISISLLTRTIRLLPEHIRTHQVGGGVMLVSGVLTVLLGFTSLESIPLLIVVVLLLLAPVLFAFRVWIGMLEQN